MSLFRKLGGALVLALFVVAAVSYRLVLGEAGATVSERIPLPEYPGYVDDGYRDYGNATPYRPVIPQWKDCTPDDGPECID